MQSNRLYPIELVYFDATTLTNAYQCINDDGIERPCNILRFISTSDVAIMISYDGINDHDVIRRLTAVDINAQLNKQPNGFVSLFAKGTKIYVKYILGAAKSGYLRITGYSSE